MLPLRCRCCRHRRHEHRCLLLPNHAAAACPRPRRPQENRLGQKFVVDATLVTDLSHAGKSDDIARTVNYAAVYE